MIVRKIYKKLYDEHTSHKITILLGPRQVGKSTVLKQLHASLGGIYLDLDILENVEEINSYSKAIGFFKTNGYEEGTPFYVFLDEFQKYADLSTILKNIYDNHPTIKIYATGSSSLEIKKHIQESLAGRKFIHTLYSLDFEEFLEFKNADMKKYARFRSIQGDVKVPIEFRELLEEYLLYGGYPEVVLSENKEQILASIFDLYIKKDLVDYFKPTSLLKVKALLRHVALLNAKQINISDLVSAIGLTRYEILEYLEVLQETYLIEKVIPFYSNKLKELVKEFKVYLLDPGMLNYFTSDFRSISHRQDTGFLFETFVLGELRKEYSCDIKFWKLKTGQEIDFILDFVSYQVPLEVKFKEALRASDYRGLTLFEERYGLKGCLVNMGKVDKNHRLPFELTGLTYGNFLKT